MAISEEQTQQMMASAGGLNMNSIGEEFNSQLSRLKGIQQAQDAYTPQAEQNARAIGDVTDRASGEAPVQIAAQGVALTDRLGKIKEDTTSNIINVLSQMLSMQEQTGFTDGDAVSTLKDLTGLGDRIELGGTEKERGARARLLMERMANGEEISYKDLLSDQNATKVDAYLNMINNIQKAREIISQEGKQTGWGKKFLRNFRIETGMMGEDEGKLGTILSNIAAGKAFGDAGKALTKEERSIIEDYIIGVNKGEAFTLGQLEQLEEEFKSKIYGLAGDFAPINQSIETDGESGFIRMTGPKGSFDVPADQVKTFEENGYKKI